MPKSPFHQIKLIYGNVYEYFCPACREWYKSAPKKEIQTGRGNFFEFECDNGHRIMGEKPHEK